MNLSLNCCGFCSSSSIAQKEAESLLLQAKNSEEIQKLNDVIKVNKTLLEDQMQSILELKSKCA